MTQSTPYQPALLRLLHGAAAILVILALITGFWVYNTYDQRWGRLPLPGLADIQGIHGTIALAFLLLSPFFAFYSLRLGSRRLIQDQTLSQLKQVGQPLGWVAWHRIANTLMLLATTLALITGRMMKEEWLPAGEIQRPWYLAHLLAWACVLASVGFHVLMGAKVGGTPLLRSMFQWTRREGDAPQAWWQDLKQSLSPNRSSQVLRVLEGIVIGGILLAFIVPVFSP